MSTELKNGCSFVFDNWMDYLTIREDEKYIKYQDLIRKHVQNIIDILDVSNYVFPYIYINFDDNGNGEIQITFNHDRVSDVIFPVISYIYETLKNIYNVSVSYPKYINTFEYTGWDGWEIIIKNY